MTGSLIHDQPVIAPLVSGSVVLYMLAFPAPRTAGTIITPTEERLEHHDRKPGRPNDVQRLVYLLLGIDWTNLPVIRKTYKMAQCAKT